MIKKTNSKISFEKPKPKIDEASIERLFDEDGETSRIAGKPVSDKPVKPFERGKSPAALRTGYSGS